MVWEKEGFMSSEKISTLIDMDGVIAGFDLHILEELRRRDPTYQGSIEDFTEFYTAQNFDEPRAGMVREIHNEPGFFLKLPVFEGAVQAWQAMQEGGLYPRICTSPLTKNPTCEEDKRSWLEEHFVPHVGYSIVDEMHITKDKHEVPGIVLVDDRPKIRMAEIALWQHVLFDQPYNRLEEKPRIMNWTDGSYLKIIRQAIEESFRSESFPQF
jgi:5'-nucleotidase